MKDLLHTYNQNIEQFTSQFNKKSKFYLIVVYLRLTIFLSSISAIYFLWGNNNLVSTIAIIGIIIFFFLVRKSIDLKEEKNYFQNLISINKNEVLSLYGTYQQYNDGSEYINPQHEYSYDIDLFGNGSFFQYINRTTTNGGSNLLAKGLTESNYENILDRQESIKELSRYIEWRQSFMATATLINTNISDKDTNRWIQKYKPVFSKSIKYLLWIFPLLSILLFVSVYQSFLPIIYIYIWIGLGLGISSIFLKRINAIHSQSTQLTLTLKQYTKLLKLIEQQSFDSKILSYWKSETQQNGLIASQILNKLYRIFNNLDNRSNILTSIFLNGFFLADMRVVYKLDNWISTYSERTNNWFLSIYNFDEMISSANFHYNHPNFEFPTINNNDFLIKVKDLGHPLISNKKRINNNFQIKKENFTIITGANMAGKSTFLRALGINIAMANNGLPVCAAEMNYTPIKLISSMRTTDSLNKEESYFFSELKRLKYIIDASSQENHFIILDEILKGTNSKDKAEGSKKFLERMKHTGSTGVIATHDLSLCTLSSEYNQFTNQYFDAEIINDELYFDYKLKDGQCKNMNASFLLKKMDII